VTAFLFVGPTLEPGEAQALVPSATVLPPVCIGGVLNAVHHGATIIGIIDGLFEQVLPVWHKEILFALSQGVHVLGASSMGALRAAELHAFGMEGIGQVFEGFRSGAYEDDDEVAVAHAAAEHGHKPLSEAMVNLRAGLAQALSLGLLTEGEHALLVRETKARFYTERSWAAVFAIGRANGIPNERLSALAEHVRSSPPNVKRADALLLLRRVQELALSNPPPHRASFDFERTVFWENLVERRDESTRRSDGAPLFVRDPISPAEIVAHTKLRRGRALVRAALGAWLCEREGERAGITVDLAAWRAAAARFRRERGLESAADLAHWMTRHSVSEDDFARLVHREALFELLVSRHEGEIDARILDLLKQNGELADVQDDVRRRGQLLRRGDLDELLDREQLVDWFIERAGPFDPSIPIWKQARFHDEEAFLREVRVLVKLDERS
jgi:hypothetical protein